MHTITARLDALLSQNDIYHVACIVKSEDLLQIDLDEFKRMIAATNAAFPVLKNFKKLVNDNIYNQGFDTVDPEKIYKAKAILDTLEEQL